MRTAIEPHAPAGIAALNPGATRAAIRELEELVGAALPEDFAASLAVHDGHRGPYMSAALFDSEYLLSTNEIARVWRLRKDVLADLGPSTGDAPWWDERLIPATEADGNGFCVHLDSGAVYYHVHDDTMEGPLFPSWLDFLEALAEKVEAGEFELELDSVWIEFDDAED